MSKVNGVNMHLSTNGIIRYILILRHLWNSLHSLQLTPVIPCMAQIFERSKLRVVKFITTMVWQARSRPASRQHVVLCRRRQLALACLAVWRRMAEHSRRRLVMVSIKHVLFVSSRIAYFSVVTSEVWPQEPDLTLQSCINCVLAVCVIIIEHVNQTSVCSVPGCGQKHTKFLHLDVTVNSNSTADTSVSTAPVRNSHANSHGSNIHLPLVAVNVNDHCQVYAWFDSGSTNIFVTRGLAARLNLSGPRVKYQMSTLSESADLTVPVVSMCLSSMHATCPASLNNILVIPEIPARAPSVDIDVNNYPHLAGISILELGENLQANMLIGMDNAHLLMPLEIKCNGNVPNQPYAMRTFLGGRSVVLLMGWTRAITSAQTLLALTDR